MLGGPPLSTARAVRERVQVGAELCACHGRRVRSQGIRVGTGAHLLSPPLPLSFSPSLPLSLSLSLSLSLPLTEDRGDAVDDGREDGQVLRLGFRVQGLGFRVQGSGFRVQGSGFRVQGSGFRVRGSGFVNTVRCSARPAVRVISESFLEAQKIKGFLALQRNSACHAFRV